MPSEMEQLADEMVRQCMDDPDAIGCAIEMIRAIPDDICKPEMLFFTKEQCTPCVEDREKYADELAEGTIREVSAVSKEGKDIMDRNNLQFTPSLALIDCKGNLIGEFYDSSLGDVEKIDSTDAGS